jgi:hypothetical protein
MIKCSIHGPQSGPACAECDERLVHRGLSDIQLEGVVDAYIEEMRARGHDVSVFNREAIRRAASIQDAWRVSFAKIVL